MHRPINSSPSPTGADAAPLTALEHRDELICAGAFDDPALAHDPAARELAEGLAILAAQASLEVTPDPAFMDELALFARAAAPDTAPSPRRRLKLLAPLAVAASLVLGFVALAPHRDSTPTRKPGVITLTHERPSGVTGSVTTTIPEGVQAFDANGNPLPASPPAPVTTQPSAPAATPGTVSAPTAPGTPTP